MENNRNTQKESHPLVSVCVPVYGVEKYLERCARSLFEQTYTNIEYIFVDDCSPDRSIEVLEKTANEYPERKGMLRIFCHKINGGLGASRNTAIENVSGIFQLWVDSDDYIDKDVVERLVGCQQKHDADIVSYPQIHLFSDRQEKKYGIDVNDPEVYLRRLFKADKAGNLCGNLIRNSLFADNHIRVEGGVNQSEDFQVLTRLVFFAKRLDYIDGSYYYYDRTREGSYTNRKTEKSYDQIRTTMEVLNEFFLSNNRPDLAKMMWISAASSLCRGKMRLAKDGNKHLYDIVCSMIDYDKKMAGSLLPVKYEVVSRIKNYSAFRGLMTIKKLFGAK